MWKTLKNLTYRDMRYWIKSSIVNGILKIGIGYGIIFGILIWIMMISIPSMNASFSSKDNYLGEIKYFVYPVIFCLGVALVGVILGFIRLLIEARIKNDSTYAKKYKQHLLTNKRIDINTFLDCADRNKNGIINLNEFEIIKANFINNPEATILDLYALTVIDNSISILLNADEFKKKKQFVLANSDKNMFKRLSGHEFMNILTLLKDNGTITVDEFTLKKKQYSEYTNKECVKILLFLLKIFIPAIFLLVILKYFNL